MFRNSAGINDNAPLTCHNRHNSVNNNALSYIHYGLILSLWLLFGYFGTIVGEIIVYGTQIACICGIVIVHVMSLQCVCERILFT